MIDKGFQILESFCSATAITNVSAMSCSRKRGIGPNEANGSFVRKAVIQFLNTMYPKCKRRPKWSGVLAF